MTVITVNNQNSSPYEFADAERLPKSSAGINDFSSAFSKCFGKDYWDDMGQRMMEEVDSRPILVGVQYESFSSLRLIHENLKQEYTSLTFASNARLTGPLYLTTLQFSASDQIRKIHLIIPDFAKTSESLHPLLEEENPELETPTNHSNRWYHNPLFRVAKKVAMFIYTTHMKIFTFLLTPITNARLKKEAILDRIIENFHDFNFLQLEDNELEKKCEALKMELETVFPSKRKSGWKFWRNFDTDSARFYQNNRDFWKGSIVNTPTILGKYFIATYLLGCRYYYSENIKLLLKLPLPEDLQFQIHNIRYFDAKRGLIRNTNDCFAQECKEIIDHSTEELKKLKQCLTAKALQKQILSEIIHPLDNLLKSHLEVYMPFWIKDKTFSPDSDDLNSHLGTLRKDRLLNLLYPIWKRDEQRSVLAHALYGTSLDLFYPETLIKTNIFIFCSELLFARNEFNYFECGYKYNCIDTEMKELLKQLITTPNTFADYDGLLAILEHNCLELHALHERFEEELSFEKTPKSSTFEIEEVL